MAAFSNIEKALSEIVSIFKSNNLSDMLLCPETMGKKKQNGNMEEIMKLCEIDDMIYPTIDFGHLHARGIGAINSIEDYKKILDIMKNILSNIKYKNFHSHFSRIEYTMAGEKRHRTFDDEGFGPDFAPLAKLVKEKGLSPTFICESRGTMAKDAVRMKKDYDKA